MEWSALLSGCAARSGLSKPLVLALPSCNASRKPKRAKLAVQAARGDRQGSVSVAPQQAQDPPAPSDLGAPVALGLVAAAAAVAWRRLRGTPLQWRNSSVGQSQYDAALGASPADGREYRMALARTRQAVAVHRAIGFMNTGNLARAMVELRRALHENSVCRASLINTQHEARELAQLYRLHLQNCTPPADFATLLQLRTLLDLDFEKAELMEQEVMQQGAAYSI